MTPTPVHRLTERQKDVVIAIRTFWEMHGYGPTHRELAYILQLSLQRIAQLLNALRVAGVVAWNDGKARTIRLVVRT